MSVADLVTKADLPAVVRDLRAKLKLVARARRAARSHHPEKLRLVICDPVRLVLTFRRT
jgi:hypothetical protein